MNPKKFTTVSQVDQRLEWLRLEINTAQEKADTDTWKPNVIKHLNRVRNLKHEKVCLEKRRSFLQTPELALK
jgi:hypothetical protein